MDFKRILVAINGTRIDEKTIALACSLAKKNKGKVYIAYVIEIDRSLPLDAEVKPAVDRAESAVSIAEKCAEGCDYEIVADILQARAAGPALVDEATERKVDVIVLGMEYEVKFGEFTMGEVVPHLFKYAPCQVIVWRDAAPIITDQSK